MPVILEQKLDAVSIKNQVTVSVSLTEKSLNMTILKLLLFSF
jgi:hypothetical protein